MLTLLSPARRAWLIGFWLVMSLGSGLLIGLCVALLFSPRWLGCGAILALVLALPGLRWPRVIARPYRAWNTLARCFGRAARLWLMGICYYIIIVAVGRTGSALSLAHPPPTASLWVPRGTLTAGAYGSQHGAATAVSPEQGWAAAFLTWAAQSGNVWAVFLLPFFALLTALQDDRHKSNFPANIYTLF